MPLAQFQGLPPGARGYMIAEGQAQEAGQRNLAGLTQATQLQGALQKMQMEQQMKAELATADTPEKQAAVAMKYGGPQAVLSHLDRQDRNKQTKELALSRLAQVAANAENTHQRAMAALSNQKDRDAETARHRNILEQINAERLKYDTGAVVSVPPPAAPTPMAPPAPAVPAPQSAPQGMLGPQQISQIGPQSAVTNPQMAADQARILQAEQQPGGGGMLPVTSVIPDARVAPTTAPASPAEPVMPPMIANAPKKIQDKWRADQAKSGGTAPETVVDAIIEGRMQLPTGFALRSPYWQEVIARVAQKDPKFDATKYGARAAARRTFASGPEARNVTALNTVIGHLGTLDEMAAALDNKDLRAYNAVTNRLSQELGDPRIVNFEVARQAVAEETMRVFRQVNASEQEVKHWKEVISSASSPKQLRGSIATLGDLLDSRIQAIARQYDRTVNEGSNPSSVDPKNRVILDRLRGNAGSKPDTGGFSDADKERRYQEWKAKQ